MKHTIKITLLALALNFIMNDAYASRIRYHIVVKTMDKYLAGTDNFIDVKLTFENGVETANIKLEGHQNRNDEDMTNTLVMIMVWLIKLPLMSEGSWRINGVVIG